MADRKEQKQTEQNKQEQKQNNNNDLIQKAQTIQAIQNVQREAQAAEELNKINEQEAQEAIQGFYSRVIDSKAVREAQSILEKYKQGKEQLEQRIIENERWWKMRHWEIINGKNGYKNIYDPQPVSAWLFNSIANKHADVMDNYPEPNVLPREESDTESAKVLSEILPVILEQRGFEDTYSNTWWYKLKMGTGVYGVFWNKTLENGAGDIDIKQIDLLNIFWEPGIKDIQDSQNVFVVSLVDNDVIRSTYGDVIPELKTYKGAANSIVKKYIYDENIDTSEKSPVIDWYYKVENGGKTILHYCKFIGDIVLYASENEEAYRQTGYYNHGMYPFVFDTLFAEEGSPAGFGYIDVMKDTQLYIDKLNNNILKSSLVATKPRYFATDDCNVNVDEFCDMSKDIVHVAGRMDEGKLKKIEYDPIDSIYLSVLQMKVDELKETSGNTDFAQGSTTSGVTAASAIAALQEAGSKLSRDMIKTSYRKFVKINYLIIELIRQFYDEPRSFRIIGDNETVQFIEYTNAAIKEQNQGIDFGLDMGVRLPVFDIKITAQKNSPFSRVSQNELAKELYSMNFFNPQMTDQSLIALEMMNFEGKDQVIEKVMQNGTLYNTIMQMQDTIQKLQILVDNAYNSNLTEQNQGQQSNTRVQAKEGTGKVTDTNSLGKAVQSSENTTAATAAQKATNIANPNR